jgi:protein farnesyltransferase/geranylgeranyltransferase type-1 subunit alpha
VIENNSVATILYSDGFKHLMGLFRALQKNKEYSERALFLTSKVIEVIAAHYTVWQYRFDNIIALKKDINEELDWVEQIALDNPKNYQIWGYRQLLLKHSRQKVLQRELPILDIMIADDSKNYHVWSYRKWIVQWCDDYSHELAFVDKCLKSDVYNNSAWCHRFFVIAHSLANWDDELEYVKRQIEISPKNESSWNYIVGLFDKYEKPLSSLESFALSFANLDDEHIESVPALEVLVKIYKEQNTRRALKGYELLSSKYDTIRSKYWEYQKGLISS